MRHLLWLLPLFLLAWPVQSLKCHQCLASGNCFQPTSCRADARYCLTTWNSPPGQKTLVIKSCAYTCPGFQESLSYSRASCCNTDLCNSSVSLSASWGLLVLSVWGAYLIRAQTPSNLREPGLCATTSSEQDPWRTPVLL
uniref:lymphocyte antigen 6D-like n=1 Tax=Ictidomys tridecemlineatus TaxID=43179 RepID=UPI001A9F7C7E|nr:lymphocyte antigen 6D-like [Ictidomys tridecemlineatus]